jgi:hypothetical protein
VTDIDPSTPESGGTLIGTFRVAVVPDFPGSPRPFLVSGDVGGDDQLPLNEPAVIQAGSCGPENDDD